MNLIYPFITPSLQAYQMLPQMSAMYRIPVDQFDIVISGDVLSAGMDAIMNGLRCRVIDMRSANLELKKITNELRAINLSQHNQFLIVRSFKVSTDLDRSGFFKMYVCHFEPSQRCHIFAWFHIRNGLIEEISTEYGCL